MNQVEMIDKKANRIYRKYFRSTLGHIEARRILSPEEGGGMLWSVNVGVLGAPGHEFFQGKSLGDCIRKASLYLDKLQSIGRAAR